MDAEEMDKEEAKAFSLLEDRTSHDDAEAMLMLAKCYAFGRGIEQDMERAEALVTESANKGNDEAQKLVKLLHEYKGNETIIVTRLHIIAS